MAAQRRKDALVGCFTADAASMPLHWIYDNAKLKEAIADCEDPLFFGTPSCPFYNSSDGENGFPGHYQVGQLSPYGEQALACLLFVQDRAGPLDGDEFAAALNAWAKSFTGRPDHALKGFCENVDSGAKYPATGADDDQAQSFGKVAPAMFAYGEDAAFLENVEVLVRAHQNNDLNVACGLFWARLLQGVVAGDAIPAAYAAAKEATTNEQLLEAFSRTEASLEKGVHEFLMEYGAQIKPTFPAAGLSCANPQATMGALHTVLKAKSFREGVTKNLLAGGDNCSRSTAVGAVLGAAFGVPPELSAKVKVPELASHL